MEKPENKGKKMNPKNLKTQKQTQNKRERKSEIHHSLCLRRKEKKSKKLKERHTSEENIKSSATHQFGEELQNEVGEEDTQSNDWKFGKK